MKPAAPLLALLAACLAVAGCTAEREPARLDSSETVLLDFYSDSCPPCRRMIPTLDRLTEQGYPIRRINVDQNTEMAREFGINAIPCFVLMVDGKEVERQLGYTDYYRMERMFTDHNVSAN